MVAIVSVLEVGQVSIVKCHHHVWPPLTAVDMVPPLTLTRQMVVTVTALMTTLETPVRYLHLVLPKLIAVAMEPPQTRTKQTDVFAYALRSSLVTTVPLHRHAQRGIAATMAPQQMMTRQMVASACAPMTFRASIVASHQFHAMASRIAMAMGPQMTLTLWMVAHACAPMITQAKIAASLHLALPKLIAVAMAPPQT
jgi:hypothetical protein